MTEALFEQRKLELTAKFPLMGVWLYESFSTDEWLERFKYIDDAIVDAEMFYTMVSHEFLHWHVRRKLREVM